ncbi:hypothetical protein [Curtobacterium sp. Leaf261]|nr:hypothetical protein [Curtobacterium sp. Leaf261]
MLILKRELGAIGKVRIKVLESDVSAFVLKAPQRLVDRKSKFVPVS